MAEKTCPACGIANPAERVTCMACHEPLSRNEAPQQSPPEVPPPAKKTRKKRSKKVAPLKDTKPIKDVKPVNPFQEGTPPKTTIAAVKAPRKRRKKAIKVDESEYFTFIDGKLVPIAITMKMQRTSPSESATSLIRLWNRNKGLLK